MELIGFLVTKRKVLFLKMIAFLVKIFSISVKTF